jgi:hypothetical protein
MKTLVKYHTNISLDRETPIEVRRWLTPSAVPIENILQSEPYMGMATRGHNIKAYFKERLRLPFDELVYGIDDVVTRRAFTKVKERSLYKVLKMYRDTDTPLRVEYRRAGYQHIEDLIPKVGPGEPVAVSVLGQRYDLRDVLRVWGLVRSVGGREYSDPINNNVNLVSGIYPSSYAKLGGKYYKSNNSLINSLNKNNIDFIGDKLKPVDTRNKNIIWPSRKIKWIRRSKRIKYREEYLPEMFIMQR